MPDDKTSTPDIWEEIKAWIYANFGLRGLAALAVAAIIFYVWTQWEDVKKWPGVAWLLEHLTRQPVPKANPARFSVMVARLANDEQGKNAKLIADLLAEFEGVQTLQLDRTIEVKNQGKDAAGHALAREYLQTSGASILIWGRVLSLNGKTIPQLNISTSHGASKRPKQYAVETENVFRLPALLWEDLAEIIRLQIFSSAEEFTNPGKYVADRLPQQIERVKNLLAASTSRPEWDAAARAAIQVVLANALQTLGNQTGQNQPLEQAVEAYRAALEERTRERVPLNWALRNIRVSACRWTGP